jgi:hypothetical protein
MADPFESFDCRDLNAFLRQNETLFIAIKFAIWVILMAHGFYVMLIIEEFNSPKSKFL